jgi:hypothetical protein
MITRDHPRTFFAEPLPPGEERVVDLSIHVPPEPGEYLIEIDIVWEGVAWFKDKGNPTCIVELKVEVK